MERLEKLINILKLTPHRQPELVKEATHRILSRSIKTDPQVTYFLRPLIEILIQYCDQDDSAQRSLFNDYLNSVILTYQHQNYQLILHVLLDEVINNGSARTVTAALHRISHIIHNIQPVELGCDPQKLLKALIEVSRRSDEESVLKAFDSALKETMPFLDHYVRNSKEMQLLSNTLVEILLRNLQNESSQTKRLSASSLASVCSACEMQSQNTLIKLKLHLDSLFDVDDKSVADKFVGFCLCVKEIPLIAQMYYNDIIEMILKHVGSSYYDITIQTAALETLREMIKFQIDESLINKVVKIVIDKFLISEVDGEKIIKKDTKVLLQVNALSCLAVMVKQKPTILDDISFIYLFKNSPDVAVRNQLIVMIGNYIEASWRFPLCVEQSIGCERIRKLWVELRTILIDDNAHPDTSKSCAIAMKTCLKTLMESDHCLHIIEYRDILNLINIYLRTTFKPLKIELLSLFASINYRTLHYLERNHWSKMRVQMAGSFTDSLQDQIVNKVIIAALTDDYQRVRAAATTALVSIVPNLYITNLNNGQKNILYRTSDAIASLAQDLSNEHLVVLKQADEHINHSSNGDEPLISSDLHEKLCIRNDHKFLSSSIVQPYDNPYNEQIQSQLDLIKSQHRVNVLINLMYIINLLRTSIEDSLEKGKTAISSIVRTLYELSLVYPVYQYSTAWDCRPSEYCECFTLLNFLLTYMENLNEPDVVVEDLEAYKNFLLLSHQILYALCHESVLSEYEHQKMKPFHKRQASMQDGSWSELALKHPCIADTLEVYFTHLTKLLWLISYIIEERSNPFAMAAKQVPSQQKNMSDITQPASMAHYGTLVSNRLLFGCVYKKLESSFKSSRKNLNQNDEKFYQILETCLSSMSSLLEFISMGKTLENVKDILSYLRITSQTCSVPSLICARQLLKSLFGINIIALYQVDPNDWFEEESWSTSPTNLISQHEDPSVALQGVYHHLVSNPYKIFSSYYSMNCSQITPTSDKALAILNFETRRSLKVRRRIEERVKSLFEYNPNQLVSAKVRQISEILKNTIADFTPIVTECMTNFGSRGFCLYQSEILHFMSYLLLLRVNYQKLALAGEFVNSINKLLDYCGEKVFLYREAGLEMLLRNSFTFMILLTYERGPSKPLFQVATIIQKLDDVRAKLTMSKRFQRDVSVYVVPLLRCLVEDLFLYRTEHFQGTFNKNNFEQDSQTAQTTKDRFEILEAERETVAQKLIDAIDNPRIYDLLSILILESRQNSSEIKYKKLSQQLLSIIPTMLSKQEVNLVDYRCIELTRRIIENISPEVFQPVNFIFETLLESQKPPIGTDTYSIIGFQRWMSLVIIAVHILITQVKEEVFLTRLLENMSIEVFVEYLLHIPQLCISQILVQLYSPVALADNPNIVFLSQQLSSYILYLTHMFQSGLFCQLSRSAASLIKKEVEQGVNDEKSFKEICEWSRDPMNPFSLSSCDKMFLYCKLIYPDLTISWCNVMMLLNNVDCNRDFWRELLVYECHHCKTSDSLNIHMKDLSIKENEDTTVSDFSGQFEDVKFKRDTHINRPSSLNLSDISFSDQLRRSFIKKIAASESRDKTFNRNIIETSDEDGHLLEQEVSVGNTEQCLSPNIELTRRGALCLVLDFVTISMNDVEHITWLIIHHINDIIRWSHEMPITEFINAVHGNSASSGIFIQAINSSCNNLNSISYVTRVLWTLEQVHYTQYGSLVVLLVEKLLSSPELIPYRSLTRNIEEFACSTVQRLLNETNKSLVTTNDEVVNQLESQDLDRICSILDANLYPKLNKCLLQLRELTREQANMPTIELHKAEVESDEDSEVDEIELLCKKTNQLYWMAEQNCTAHISSLMPAMYTVKNYLAIPSIVEQINKNISLVCFLVSAVYSLALNILPPPTRLSRPKFWNKSVSEEVSNKIAEFGGDLYSQSNKPVMIMESKRTTIKPTIDHKTLLLSEKADNKEEIVDASRVACLKGLFLLENIEFLRKTQFEHFPDVIIRIARLPLINSFVLTPPSLWRQNLWPVKFSESDTSKTEFPIVPHDILSKDYGLLENFCDRVLKLGWTSRRHFEEIWMTLLGVLSTSLSQPENPTETHGNIDTERKTGLLASCKVVTTITKLLLLTQKQVSGDPLSKDTYVPQSFDERVYGLTKAIGSNLTSLRKKTKGLLESIEFDRSPRNSLEAKSLIGENQNTGFSDHLKISAQKLRMNVIINVELDLQDTVVIEDEQSKSRLDEIDTESCIRLLLSLYKQKFKDPNENLLAAPPPSVAENSSQKQPRQSNTKNRNNQLAPPLTTTICQSILALSDMFTDNDQFNWMFDIFVQLFKLAERNEDEIQMQYLILGLCKSASICCYEIPTELTTTSAINHKEIMFEKCRQSINRCVKSEFGPLKINALFGIYYMLEDSINIVASGAWELDHFKHLRASRMIWVRELMPMILDKENSKLLTKHPQITKLLESLCDVVKESDARALKL